MVDERAVFELAGIGIGIVARRGGGGGDGESREGRE